MAGQVYSYAGSFTTPNNTVFFTIATDTDDGTLTSGDFISGTISDIGTLAFPTAPITVFGTSDALSATPTGLYYNFSDTDFDITQIFSSYYVNGLQLEDSNPTFGCYADGPGVGCGLAFGNSNYERSSGVAGDVPIAAATSSQSTPEPSGFVLLSFGLGTIGMVRLTKAGPKRFPDFT